MARYILKRILIMLVVLFVVSVVTFSLIHLAPGDPATLLAMARYGVEVTPEQIEWVGREMGFDAPIHVQYFIWLGHVFHGDLGASLRTDQPVLSEIWLRLPATLELVFAAMIIGLIVAIPLGVISATRQHSIIDNATMIGALIGVSMPGFWLALLLILVFSVHLGWLPVCGRGGVEHLILPAITLGVSTAAINMRVMRSSMLEVLRQDYILTARAKGLSQRVITYRHALRNALIPVVTLTGIQFGITIGMAVIIETIFAWEGIGKLLVDSIYARDFTMIQGCVLCISALVVLSNLLVDILYAYLDPQIRYENV